MAGAFRKAMMYFGIGEEATARDLDTYEDEYLEEAPSAEVMPLHPMRETLRRITTIHTTTYNDARSIGEAFREGTPVIINLTEMATSDARRVVDFCAGLSMALHGSFERVANNVFLLSPAHVEIAGAAATAQSHTGFYNQS